MALNAGNRFCTLITPEPHWTYWDDEAEKVHHVSREMLQQHGKSVQDVTRQLNDLLNGMILYSDGWVVDQPWLIQLFAAAGNNIEFHVSPLEIILCEAQMAIWHTTKDQVIEQSQLSRHRASNDAWIIQETFRQTYARIKHTRG